MKNLTTGKSKHPINMSVLIVFFTLIIGISFSCTSSLDNNKVSSNPINTAIIGISGFPSAIFGNACSESVIQVNTEIVPNGTPVEFEITNSASLPPKLRGCLFDSSGTVEGGVAFVNYLAGVLVGAGETTTVNISVTIKPINGDEESDFISVTLKGVGITAPEDAEISTESIVALEFLTFGLKPGTLITAMVGNEGLGSVDPEETIVLGTEDSGSFVLEYTANSSEGVQTVIVTGVLEIPAEFLAICPIPPAEDLLVVATVTITQTEEEEEMMEVAAP